MRFLSIRPHLLLKKLLGKKKKKKKKKSKKKKKKKKSKKNTKILVYALPVYKCTRRVYMYAGLYVPPSKGRPAWGLPVKMLKILLQKLGVSDPSARGPGDPCGPHSLGHWLL